MARLRILADADPAEGSAVTIIGRDAAAAVTALRAESGKGIWLFGGGSLCASLLAADLVDQIEVAILPVLLARGIPLVGPKAPYSRLKLTHSDASPSSIVSLHYDVQHAAG